MNPPSRTTVTTAGHAPAPPSPEDAREKPPQSGMSSGWRRPQCRSGCQLSSPGRPRATPNNRPPNRRRPEGRPRRPGCCSSCPAHRRGRQHATRQAAWGRNCRSSRPRCGPWHATGARNRPCAGPGRLTGPAAQGRTGRSRGQGRCQVPRPHQARPNPREPPQAVPAEGCFLREEATDRPRPYPQTHADGHHAAAAATTPGPSRGRGTRRGR